MPDWSWGAWSIGLIEGVLVTLGGLFVWRYWPEARHAHTDAVAKAAKGKAKQ